MLTPTVAQNAALLRLLADPQVDEPWHYKKLAQRLERDEENTRKSCLKLTAEGVVVYETGQVGLTDAGRNVVAALDVAEGKAARAAAGDGPADYLALPHARISPDPLNPRTDWDSPAAVEALDELAADIAANGLLQNLVVKPAGADANGVRYAVVGGERRWRAIGRLIERGDWPADHLIACKVVEVDELGHRMKALAENLKRRNLNYIEEAQAYAGLVEAGVKTADLAGAVNVTQRMIQQRLQLLQLSPDKQAQVAAGTMTVEQARQEIQRLNGLKLDLPPLELLALAEIATKLEREPFKTDQYASNKAEIADQVADELAALKTRYLIHETLRSSVHGGRSFAWLAYGVEEKLAHTVEGFRSDRDGALDRLRRAALGDEAADAASASGRYALDWLNGPFEPPAEVVAEIEARERQQAEDAQRRRDAEAFAQETSAARLRDVLDLQRQLAEVGRIGAVREEFEQCASMLRAPLPWFYDDQQNQVYDAVGAVVRTLYFYNGAYSSDDKALRQLLVTAVNAAAGLPTPAERPVPGGPRGAFVRAMADHFQTVDQGMPRTEAEQRASDALDGFLEDEGVEFGADGHAWDRDAAVIIGQRYETDHWDEAPQAEAAQ